VTERTIRCNVDVTLMQHVGSDSAIVAAAKVSTKGAASAEDFDGEAGTGLINFLMKNRHGTPFEHNSFTFLVSAPICVFREFHRHRIGFSFNEESGRYKQLDPVFYVPGADRALVQVGKPGHYTYVPGTPEQWQRQVERMTRAYDYAYAAYVEALEDGVAKEVARMVLPVGLFSSMYVTCNTRSMMAFLSLRTKRVGSTFPSFPMREIEMVAEKMEAEFARLFPITHAAFDQHGRVSP
jgi:thymidylate synthase (FAD)